MLDDEGGLLGGEGVAAWGVACLGETLGEALVLVDAPDEFVAGTRGGDVGEIGDSEVAFGGGGWFHVV